jgi:hypothetical protein
MVSGDFWGEDSSLYYAFYVGMEDKVEQHVNPGDVGSSFGGRLLSTVSEKLSLGVSAFTAKDQVTRSVRPVMVMGKPSLRRFGVESPREFTWGADMQYKFPGDVTLEAEIARSNFESIGDRLSYYVRVKKEIDRWTPFVTFDTYTDDDDPVFRARGNRYGAGVGYRINNSTYIKGEYHFHDFSNDQKLSTVSSNASDTSHMVRVSLVYTF